MQATTAGAVLQNIHSTTIMSNYNILQLNAKDLPELKEIATALGLKVPNSIAKDILVYEILDQQAVVNAQKTTASDGQDGQRKRKTRGAAKASNEAAPQEKAAQRAMLQYFRPENRRLILDTLVKLGREDLIGTGSDCLVPPDREYLRQKAARSPKAGRQGAVKPSKNKLGEKRTSKPIRQNGNRSKGGR